MDPGAIAMKGYTEFLKAPALLKPRNQMVKCHRQILIRGVLPLCRDAVRVFFGLSRLGLELLVK